MQPTQAAPTALVALPTRPPTALRPTATIVVAPTLVPTASLEAMATPVPLPRIVNMAFFPQEIGWSVVATDSSPGQTRIFRTTDSGKHWTLTNTASTFSGPSFSSATSAWTFDTRTLFATHDGGATWQQVHVFDNPIGYIFQQSALFGWVATVTDHTTIWQYFVTTDGGKSWQPSPGMPVAAIFGDATTGWAYSNDDNSYIIFVKSGDAGRSWQPIQHPCGNIGYRGGGPISAVGAKNGWALCQQTSPSEGPEEIYRTRDGGQSWQVVTTFDQRDLAEHSEQAIDFVTDIFFIDPIRGWLSTTANDTVTLRATNDGGATWQIIATLPGDYNTLQFISPKVGYIRIILRDAMGGQSTHLMRSSDGGRTWASIDPPQ